MKKIIGLLLAASICCLAFAGCTVNQTPDPVSGSISCEELLAQLLDAGETACDKSYHYGEKDYTTYFEYWYDMPMQFVTDGAIAIVANGSVADEISVLYPQSDITYSTALKALTARAESRAEDFSGIDDDQAQRAENATVVESGGYLLFVIADEPGVIVESFYQLTE